MTKNAFSTLPDSWYDLWELDQPIDFFACCKMQGNQDYWHHLSCNWICISFSRQHVLLCIFYVPTMAFQRPSVGVWTISPWHVFIICSSFIYYNVAEGIELLHSFRTRKIANLFYSGVPHCCRIRARYFTGIIVRLLYVYVPLRIRIKYYDICQLYVREQSWIVCTKQPGN